MLTHVWSRLYLRLWSGYAGIGADVGDDVEYRRDLLDLAREHGAGDGTEAFKITQTFCDHFLGGIVF